MYNVSHCCYACFEGGTTISNLWRLCVPPEVKVLMNAGLEVHLMKMK